MSDPDQPDLDPKRKKLLHKKLGSILLWRKPELIQSVGPYHPEVFQSFDERRLAVIDKCKDRLRQIPDEFIDTLLKVSSSAPLARPWTDFQYGEIIEIRNSIPPWYAGGFGLKGYEADFEYWGMMRSVSMREALCLSIGIEPDRISQGELDKLTGQSSTALIPPLRFLSRRYDLLRRTFDPGRFRGTVKLKELLVWANQVQFELHPGLIQAIGSRQASPDTSQSETRVLAARPDRREIDKIAQLFTAIAIDYLGYRPDQARGPVPKEIAELAASMGLSVSDDTVRKYLRHGASFIPDDWTQPPR